MAQKQIHIDFGPAAKDDWTVKTMFFRLIFPTLLLMGCQSVPVPPPSAARPASLSAALAQAQTELKANRLGSAWVLAANQDGRSEEKAAFLRSVQAAFDKKLKEAKGETRRTQDLEATVSLMATGHWEPPVPTPTASLSTVPSQWLQGTVTVFVDRGLRLEDGAAVPDIVLGSGFFVSADGYLLTNHHVIESMVDPKASIGARLSVALPDSKGIRIPARVVGWDRNLDLALLKVDYKPPYVFTLGTGPDPIPGQKLQAIGSPGGLEQTLTEGIASSQRRPLLSMGEVIQIDVAVNPGNSGGPLLDSSGQVVGIVFAGIQGFQGVNFAIPASLVQKDLPRLQVGGAAVLPWVGLGLQEDEKGLEVLYISPLSPGNWAGIQVGDRLTGVAGVPVKEINEAQVRLLDFGTDAVIPLDLIRDGKPLVLWTTLEQRPEFPLEDASRKDLVAKVIPLAFGVVVKDVGKGTDRSFTVVKVWPGSAAEDLSLSEGDSLDVLQWVVNLKDHSLRTDWKVKRKVGKGQEEVVKMALPLAVREFL
jgi:S1-C subfamily serine protease